MKRTLLFIACVLASLTMTAQEELAVEDIQNSGCQAMTRGEEYVEPVPTIVLTKEGSTLSVQLLNYVENCCVQDFGVVANVSGGGDGAPCSVSIIVSPDSEYVCNCICPFNVSFTVRDLEPNSFYLDCWWYKGIIVLTEGEPLVLEYNNPDPKELLYGEWRLVGWNDGGNWFEVDPKYVGHHHLSIEIPKEGNVMAYSMANEMVLGHLTLNGNEMIFDGEGLMTQVYCDIMENLFFEDHIFDIKSYQMEGKLLKLYYTDNDFFEFCDSKETGNDYRPFIEEGKVWKVGYGSRSPIQFVDYYYFDGDTIINGKTCKQMMRQRYVSPDYEDYGAISQLPLLSYVGAYFEEDQKVYYYNASSKQLKLWYDFSLDAYGTVKINNYGPYVVGPRQTGGIKGFKGVYRDVMRYSNEEYYHNNTWLEGVGSIEGPIFSVYYGKEGHGGAFLMSCTVGDEVIYLNDEFEDGATPAEARKRIDFTHTIKTKPKMPRRETDTSQGEEDQLYGEYNNLQLDINLNPLDDAYLVRITDETGKAVYEKNVNAASIVGLNIDISTYAEGRYTVTVENSQESFTGVFETVTTGISDAERLNDNGEMINGIIYNLQGQRIRSPQKGLNIVNGQKVLVK